MNGGGLVGQNDDGTRRRRGRTRVLSVREGGAERDLIAGGGRSVDVNYSLVVFALETRYFLGKPYNVL